MNKQVSRGSLTSFLFCCLIFSSVFSYTNFESSIFKIASYGLAGLSLVGLTLLIRPVRGIIWYFSICFALLALSIISLGLNSSAGGILNAAQFLAMPLVIYGLISSGFSIMQHPNRIRIVKVVGAIGLLYGLLGVIHIAGIELNLPLMQSAVRGRYVFGTSIPSTSGIALNVNYFATIQATLFLTYMWLLPEKNRRSSSLFIPAFLLFTSVLGSSRGIIAGLAGALGLYILIRVLLIPRLSRFIIILTSIIIIPTTAFSIFYLQPEIIDEISTILRLERGLNTRDLIWADSMELWREQPFFGHGAGLGDKLGSVGSGDFEGRSLHSGYLNALVGSGIFGFTLTYTVLLIPLFRIRMRHIRQNPSALWALIIIFYYLIMSAFRTYSIGGLGLLPVITLLATSHLIHITSSNSRVTAKAAPSCQLQKAAAIVEDDSNYNSQRT